MNLIKEFVGIIIALVIIVVLVPLFFIADLLTGRK